MYLQKRFVPISKKLAGRPAVVICTWQKVAGVSHLSRPTARGRTEKRFVCARGACVCGIATLRNMNPCLSVGGRPPERIRVAKAWHMQILILKKPPRASSVRGTLDIRIRLQTIISLAL